MHRLDQMLEVTMGRRATTRTDGAHKAKYDDLANSHDPQSLPEVVRVLHLRNKAGQRDLSNEGISNVKEGVHSRHERSASQRDNINQGFTTWNELASVWIHVAWCCRITICAMLALHASKSCSQDDGNEGEESGKSGQLG